MHRPGLISIWFFIGVLLLAYGVLITGAGLLWPRVTARAAGGPWRAARRHLVGRAAARPRRRLHREVLSADAEVDGHQQADDDRRDRRQPRLLPGPSGQERPRGDHAVLEKAGVRRRRARARGDASTARSRRATRRGSAPTLFQRAPRRDRRRHRHAAQLRRRAGDRRHAAAGRPRRAGAGPGHARRAGADDHRRPARQLLRQDVGLQQPDAVRHPLLAHHAAHRGAGLAGVRARPRVVRRRLPRGARASAACASAPSARGRPPSTRSATARSCWRRTASPSRPSTSPRSSAASTA